MRFASLERFAVPLSNRQIAFWPLFCLGLICQLNSTWAVEPLKVFILAGQSNMQGHAQVRTIAPLQNATASKSLCDLMLDSSGEPKVSNRVAISSLGSSPEIKTGWLTAGYGAGGRGPKIGPEFTFGLQIEKRVEGPILIIKTAWGGKSLHTDFRPPSAKPFEFSKEQLERFAKQDKDVNVLREEKRTATGKYYRLMMEHIQAVLEDPKSVHPEYDPTAGFELAGFVWFQGWNDMVDSGVYPRRGEPGSYEQYSQLMETFIQDVRRDLKSPELPFVIGVMGVGGKLGNHEPRYQKIHGEFRSAMAKPAEGSQLPNVVAVQTADFWDEDFVALKPRDQQLQQQVAERIKAGELEKSQRGEALESLRAKEFSQGELEILIDRVSNAEYHYLGSAKILGGIGVAFADAVVGMQSNK